MISGAVRDDQARASVLDALKSAFGADKIRGDIAVDANRTDSPWLPSLRAALGALKIPGVSAAFEGETVKVGGAIVDADRETITASLKSLPGAGLTVGSIADAFAGAEATANAKAATALGSLKAGFNGDDLVAVLNQAAFSFPYGKADLPASVQDLLAKVAAGVNKLPPGYKLEVAGYTDNAGDPKADLALSQRRAEAVRGALVKAGVSSDALVARGYGGADPVYRNDYRGRTFQEPRGSSFSAQGGGRDRLPRRIVRRASTLSIDETDGVANISGAVPDEQTRGSILDALKRSSAQTTSRATSRSTAPVPRRPGSPTCARRWMRSSSLASRRPSTAPESSSAARSPTRTVRNSRLRSARSWAAG